MAMKPMSETQREELKDETQTLLDRITKLEDYLKDGMPSALNIQTLLNRMEGLSSYIKTTSIVK